MDLDLAKISQWVVEVVQGVGEELRSERAQLVRGGANPVTNLDLLADQRLAQALREIVDVPVLSEESCAAILDAGLPDTGRCWVVDPIDGTRNALAGTDLFSISVALVRLHDLRAEVAVVYVPSTKTVYQAVADGPSTRGDQLLPVTNVGHRSCAGHLMAFGVRNGAHHTADSTGELVDAIVRDGNRPRSLGAATIDICYVAEGAWCGFVQSGLKLWDFAAAALIAERAGCQVSATATLAPGDPIPIDFNFVVARDAVTVEYLRARAGW